MLLMCVLCCVNELNTIVFDVCVLCCDCLVYDIWGVVHGQPTKTKQHNTYWSICGVCGVCDIMVGVYMWCVCV